MNFVNLVNVIWGMKEYGLAGMRLIYGLKLAIYLYGLLAGAMGLYPLAKFTTFTMFTE